MTGVWIALLIFAALLSLITLIVVWDLIMALAGAAKARADYWRMETRRTASFFND